MGTIIRTCEFGIEHSRDRCRCPSTHETVRHIRCNVPDEHKEARVLTPKTLRDRMQKALRSNPPFAPVDTILDSLEEAVKDWLREAALNEFTRNEHIR